MKNLNDYIVYRKGEGMNEEPIEIGKATFYGLIDMMKDMAKRIQVLEAASGVDDYKLKDFYRKMGIL